jgi:hypothetical protein
MNKSQRPDKSKLPPMPVRDAGGSFTLDNPDDGTPIKEMFSLKDRLLLVTEKCTYEVQMADQIDPKRTNPNLPHNVHRKLFDHGVNSEVLGKTLLQANNLFKDGFLKVDIRTAMSVTLDALNAFLALDKCFNEFASAENEAIAGASLVTQQGFSFALPAIGNIDQHCKTFNQKAHHFGKALLSLARLFYPSISNWDDLEELSNKRYGSADPFSRLIAEIKPALLLILNMRDCLEHQNQRAQARDFTLEPNGTLAPPTIEMEFRKSKLDRCSIHYLMKQYSEALPVYFQMLAVNLVAKSAQPVAGLKTFVVEMSDELQRARHTRFGYAARMPDGRVLPF